MADTKPLEQLYLIAGSDTPKVRRAVARLRRRVHDETASDLNIFVYDGRVVRAATVLEEVQTPTFALGTRLLLVYDADRWPAADRDKLADYLADPAPDTCLTLVGANFKKTERLTKLAEKHKAVLRYDLPRRYELPDWVRSAPRPGSSTWDAPRRSTCWSGWAAIRSRSRVRSRSWPSTHWVGM